MATRPSKTILQGGRLLQVMADSARTPRTVSHLVEALEGELTLDQAESYLLAFEQLGIVQRQTLPGSSNWFLLGTFHIQLAMTELNGLAHDLSYVAGVVTRFNALNNLGGLLTALPPIPRNAP